MGGENRRFPQKTEDLGRKPQETTDRGLSPWMRHIMLGPSPAYGGAATPLESLNMSCLP